MSMPPILVRLPLIGAAFSALVLVLAASCSVSPITPPMTTTSSTGPPAPLLVLEATGLGAVRVGDSPDEAIATISQIAGGSNTDTGWIESNSQFGRCPGTEVRIVTWGSLMAVFSNGIDEFPDRGFFSYGYGFDPTTGNLGSDDYSLGLTTGEGIGLGSTVGALRSAYGPRLTESFDAVNEIWRFAIDEAGNSEYLDGRTTGSGTEDTVTFIERVPNCSDLTG